MPNANTCPPGCSSFIGYFAVVWNQKTAVGRIEGVLIFLLQAKKRWVICQPRRSPRQGNRICVWAAFQKWTSFFLESEPCARPMRNRSIPVRMDTVIVTVPVVGATGGRPREPLNSGHRTNWRGLFSPAPMIAWPAGFAPAPGDRRSPLQVGSSAIARRRGFAQRHRRSRPRL